MDNADSAWLLRNFAYHDVIGSVTTAEEPLIQGCYWLSENDATVDAYMGAASRVLALISETSCLGARLKRCTRQEDRIEDAEIDAQLCWQCYFSIESRLQDFVCAPGTPPELENHAYAYRSAALIYLYRLMLHSTLPGSSASGPASTSDSSAEVTRIPTPLILTNKIRAAVSATLSHISQIPLHASPECGLLFPLFFVGGDATDPADMELVISRLRSLLRDRGFGNINRATEVLEELWRLKSCGTKVDAEGGRLGVNDGGRSVDWMDVVSRMGGRVSLA